MATSDIYIDSSFLSPHVGEGNEVVIETDFERADNVGGRDLIVSLAYLVPQEVEQNITTLYSTAPTVSGVPLMYVVEYFREQSLLDSSTAVGLEYTTSSASLSGTTSAIIEYFNKHDYSLGDQIIYITFTSDSLLETTSSVSVGLKSILASSGTENVNMKYLNFTGAYDFIHGGVPIPSYSGIRYIYNDYETEANTNSGILSNYIDVVFSGWVPGYLTADIYSVLENIQQGNNLNFYFESTCISGGLTGIRGDLFSTKLSLKNYFCDVLATSLSISSIDTDVISILGHVPKLDFDVWSSVHKEAGLGIDVGLFSMYFDNFNVGVGEFIPASGTLCIDVHDALYPVVTSGTYFLVDDIPVACTYTALSDGYRMCYNSPDNFGSVSGPTKITARGQNSNGDVLTRDFYVTFGYVVGYDNSKVGGIDYGFENKIGVRVEASNLLECPIDTAFGFWFVSKNHVLSDLSASITALRSGSKGNSDLSTSIYPNSTAYFYDKIFKMEVTVKDFNGNEMPPFILKFKVENLDKKDTV